ncbi:hypothetical protein EMIHUDRAFT_222835 [Emiliania huxleyi CCMP1516]|uniref:CRAL-TRIO domain-containing protein n=2 Tax=Emiliania huxleyi TaxID=2903 RepID=A0A0D3KX87_EMIH1|nr:hypothetical protein EMIHUDRAFT_222835 [Emiliania huxleyi CCMP1516]EOD40372.1 hypothetical protein EMIHUDRAFT_222835 [Emiliania huxleyi CCMP1516]|eukprot:XP_005792801.1 hypothetical protein EMIHUDRAFT_222835 [Emiliania huxleyi CCMP1516]
MALGHDKQGRPIHLQRAGVASGKRMAEACAYFGREWQQAFMSRNIFFQELQAARMEDATQRFGHLVTQQVVIMDMAGMSFRPDQRALTIFRDFAGMMSRNYPETLYKQFIINAPRVFSAIWRIVRVWLDPNTREKVHVLGSTFAPTLLQHIDAHQLPVEYGGTSPYKFPVVKSIGEGEALWKAVVQEFNAPELLSETGWMAAPTPLG